MKPVSAVEFYTTKISDSLFLLKIWENLMSIEQMYCNESWKSLSPQLFLKFVYLGFISFLHVSIWTVILMNFLKAYLILEVAFETCIFSVFLLCWEDKSLLILSFFISEYLDQIRDEGGIFSKSPDWKPLLLFKT